MIKLQRIPETSRALCDFTVCNVASTRNSVIYLTESKTAQNRLDKMMEDMNMPDYCNNYITIMSPEEFPDSVGYVNYIMDVSNRVGEELLRSKITPGGNCFMVEKFWDV